MSRFPSLLAFDLPEEATERQVKSAYARRLKTTRPDEDPAGFQALNSLYQQALAEVRWRDQWQERSGAAEGQFADEVSPLAPPGGPVALSALSVAPVSADLSASSVLREDAEGDHAQPLHPGPAGNVVNGADSGADNRGDNRGDSKARDATGPVTLSDGAAAAVPGGDGAGGVGREPEFIEFIEFAESATPAAASLPALALPPDPLPGEAMNLLEALCTLGRQDRPEAVAEVFAQVPEFWSLAVRERVGLQVLAALDELLPPMSPGVFQAIVAYFDFDRIGSPVDAFWLMALENRLAFSWAQQSPFWAGRRQRSDALTRLSLGLGEDKWSLSGLLLGVLARPFGWGWVLLVSLIPGLPARLQKLLGTLSAEAPALVRQCLNAGTVGFWREAGQNQGFSRAGFLSALLRLLAWFAMMLLGIGLIGLGEQFSFLMRLVPLGKFFLGLGFAVVLWEVAGGLGAWVGRGLAEQPPENGRRRWVWRMLVPLICLLAWGDAWLDETGALIDASPKVSDHAVVIDSVDPRKAETAGPTGRPVPPSRPSAFPYLSLLYALAYGVALRGLIARLGRRLPFLGTTSFWKILLILAMLMLVFAMKWTMTLPVVILFIRLFNFKLRNQMVPDLALLLGAVLMAKFCPWPALGPLLIWAGTYLGVAWEQRRAALATPGPG